jgi:hypothetical protein
VIIQPETQSGSAEYENEVFVSYAWGAESETIVDELERAFDQRGIHMVRDKKDLDYKGSIRVFEERIGRGQCIILVISDAYLRSEHCMYELVEVDKNQNLRNRIFPILLSDAHIHKAIDRLDYVKYWDDQIEQLNQAIKEKINLMTNLISINESLDKYAHIRASIAHLTDLLSDMNALTPEIHKVSGFSKLIGTVEDIIKTEKKEGALKDSGWVIYSKISIKVVLLSLAGILAITVLIAAFPTIIRMYLSYTNKTPTFPSQSPPCKIVSPSRYGFDCGLSGWDKTEFYATSQAIKDVAITEVPSRDGGQSNAILITVDFTGSKSTRQAQFRDSGEVQVNLISYPPAGYENKPVSFKGKVVTAWILASSGSTGDQSHMNGVQLFVKDLKDRNCYGEWQNLKSEKDWFRIVWRESNAALCDSGFDSSQPKILGLKIAIGDNSVITYSNPLKIYLDDIDWQEP